MVSFFIILLREFFILKENKKRLTFSIIIISFYLVIIILFSVYKLYAAGVFDVGPKSNFTGSSFSSPQQWLLNLKRGYGLFIVNLFNFDLFKQLSKENLYIISSLLFLPHLSFLESSKSYLMLTWYLSQMHLTVTLSLKFQYFILRMNT